MQILPSDVVRVRRARWRVVDVRAGDRCDVLTLVGVGPANNGLERRVLSPFDLVERVERRTTPTRVPRRLWRRACRALVAGDTPPGALRCARLAQIDLLPHQLSPALALVRGLGTRVLLADDVGLGKTIQAGLIVCELRARAVADRVLVVTPAGLRDQWARELSARFTLDAQVLDVHALRESTAALPVGINPWQTVPVAIASIDFVKRADVLAAAGGCRWDVVVVDEAHGVAGDSERRAAVVAIAAQAAYVVLVTATPHSGDRRTFASLCGVGRGGADDRLLVFRRSREDVHLGGARRVHRLHVRLNREEARMHALLAGFSRAIRRQHGDRAQGSDYWLALAVLHKRALSSARSLQRSVERRLAVLGPEDPGESQLPLPLDDPAGELTPADEPPGWSPLLTLADAARERRLLGALADAAAGAARRETKIAALVRLLRRAGEPAIVFTEYRDTLLRVQESLGLPCLTLHGGMSRDERLDVIDRFTRGAGRILLATDVAAEGLNLQAACRLVINLELPWNPTRLEQRIGRVDRIGQRRAVHAFHLIARGSGESRVLSHLESRVARARADMGGGADPLGSGHDSLVARWVIDRQAAAPPQDEPAGLPRLDDRLLTPTLELEAQAEAVRVSRGRHLARARDDEALARVEGLGPCVTSARRWATRARLGNRAVMLWQIAAEDGLNRLVGSTVVALTVDGWTYLCGDDLRTRVEEAAAAWRERTIANHRAFTDARLVRETVAGARRIPHHAFQPGLPGLYARRSERARLAIAAAQGAAGLDRTGRIAAIERSRAVSFLPPQLLLVLAP